MAKITLIEKQDALPRQLNVCAYARVSCDKDTMLHSLFNQVSYFSSKIQSEPTWNYVGIYSDYAKSGTKSTRGDFEQMFQDAEDGKIDLILVKSLTRFARNTELTLKWIRRMKAINVDIYFEEERIHTLSADKGITGTSRKHRVGFNKMIQDAMDGKIDKIIMKSVQRFARNTLDTIGLARQLKEKGVEV